MPEATLWRVIVLREPKKVLAKLPGDVRQRLLAALHGLAENPRPVGYIKLQGFDLYRLRVGDWRIIYQIKDDQLLVLVVEIGTRGGVYRALTR